MTYYLAVDLGKAKRADKSDRYEIIDLSKHLDKPLKEISSLKAINDFTSNFASESDLMFYLIYQGLVIPEHCNKHFTICYKSPSKENKPGIWTRCGKKCKDQSSVLFENEAGLFTESAFINELSSIAINPRDDFDYKLSTINEQINLSLLEMLSNEIIKNDFYKFDGIDEEAYAIRNYVKEIKEHNFVNPKYYYKIVNDLVNHITYKYSKFDVEKLYPLKNKKGYYYRNDRHLFELIMFYVYCKRELNQMINKKELLLDTTPEVGKARILKKEENYEQLSFLN